MFRTALAVAVIALFSGVSGKDDWHKKEVLKEQMEKQAKINEWRLEPVSDQLNDIIDGKTPV